MGLKVELKTGERMIVGDSVIVNAGDKAKLVIEGDAAILREKDILTASEADTPCKRIYMIVQLMYLARDPAQHHKTYFELVNDVVRAAPSTLPYVDAINNEILTGAYYKALKATRSLIAYEAGLLSDVQRGTGLRQDGESNG